jgi:ATP-dependent protease Clp ATPase subunit
MENILPGKPSQSSEIAIERRMIFVVGPARSGTTVWSHQIASVFDIQCSPETNAIAILKRCLSRDLNVPSAILSATSTATYCMERNETTRSFSLLNCEMSEWWIDRVNSASV